MRILGFQFLICFFFSVAFAQSPFVTPRFIDSYFFMVETETEERAMHKTIESLIKGDSVVPVGSMKELGKLILALYHPSFRTSVVMGMKGLNGYIHSKPISRSYESPMIDTRAESLFVYMDSIAEALDHFFYIQYQERLVVVLTAADIPSYLREPYQDAGLRLAFLRELLTYKSRVPPSVLFLFLEDPEELPWSAARVVFPANCAELFRGN